MSERGWELLVYGPIVLSLLLIGAGALVLLGPLAGGPLGDLHRYLGDMLAGDDRVRFDATTPVVLAREERPAVALVLSSIGGSTAPLVPVLPAHAEAVPPETCGVIHFQGSLGIERGYLSFSRFNMVTDTDPYGQRDPLTVWKLIQFGGFSLGEVGAGTGHAVAVPVDQEVNLLISDPFSEEMLLSAKWQIGAIEVRGRYVSINAALATNLTAIGVNNAIDSPVLDCFARDSEGILVMHWVHSVDVAPAIAAGEPVYAAVTGMMYPEHCLRQ
jgi:hypothetical protein